MSKKYDRVFASVMNMTDESRRRNQEKTTSEIGVGNPLCYFFYVFFRFLHPPILLFCDYRHFFPPTFVHTEAGTHSSQLDHCLHFACRIFGNSAMFYDLSNSNDCYVSAASQLQIKLFHCSDVRYYKNPDCSIFFHFSTSTSTKMTFQDDLREMLCCIFGFSHKKKETHLNPWTNMKREFR